MVIRLKKQNGKYNMISKMKKVIDILEQWQKNGKNQWKSGDTFLDKDAGIERSWKDVYTYDGLGRTDLPGGQSLSPSPSLQELPNDELERIRRAWDGSYDPKNPFSSNTVDNTGEGFSYPGGNTVMPYGDDLFQQRGMFATSKTKPKLNGSPITQRQLDIIEGKVDPYKWVDQPNYGDNINTRNNPNVRRGDDRMLPPENMTNIDDMLRGSEVPGKVPDYALGNPPGISLDDTSLILDPTKKQRFRTGAEFQEGQGTFEGASSNLDDYYRSMDIGDQSKKMGKGIDVFEQIGQRNLGIDSQNPINFDNISSSQATNDKAREALIRAREELDKLGKFNVSTDIF
tara:strand:+ start:1466 stop:2494 length:1029 start_codon:yes stop_codon:yes gene_type:complete